MTDIVERLTGDAYTCPESMGCGMMKVCACATMEDAADEITRLRAALGVIEAGDCSCATLARAILSPADVPATTEAHDNELGGGDEL